MRGEPSDETLSCTSSQEANPFPTEDETATCCSAACKSMGAKEPEEAPACREAGGVGGACVRELMVREEDICPSGGPNSVGPTG